MIGSWTDGRPEEPACCLCGSADRRVLLEERLGGHVFGIVECRRCGLAYSCPRPSAEMQQALHTPALRNALVDAGLIAERHRIPAEQPAVFARESQEASVANYRRGLALLGRETTPGRLLDVGCAVGLFVRMAGEAGWEAVGCDVEANAVAHGRETLGLDLRRGRLEEIGFPASRFDAITLWNVIEHLNDPLATLREARRVLAPNGTLLIETPSFAARRVLCRLGLRGDPDRYLRISFEHLYHLTPRTLAAMLRRAAFGDVALHTINDHGDRRLRARLRCSAARTLAALTMRRVNLHTPILATAGAA